MAEPAEEGATSRKFYMGLSLKQRNSITHVVTSIETIRRILTTEAEQYEHFKEANEAVDELVAPMQVFKGLKCVTVVQLVHDTRGVKPRRDLIRAALGVAADVRIAILQLTKADTGKTNADAPAT